MALRWITRNGKSILYVNYSECKTEQALIAQIDEIVKTISVLPKKTLILYNLTGTSLGTEFMAQAKKAGAMLGKEKIEKEAFLGITGLKGILLDGYLRVGGASKAKTFDSEEAALDWLVS